MAKITRHDSSSHPDTATSDKEGAGQPSRDDEQLLARIRSLLPELARTEQRVARSILEDPASMSQCSITEAALAANTSETTVTRFAKAVGFDGYSQLRVALAAELARPDGKPSPDDNFAINAKRIREELGLSQEAVAEEMKKRGYSFHQATIYKIENGSRRVQVSEAQALSSIYGTALDLMLRVPDESLRIRELKRAIRGFDKATYDLHEAVRGYNSARHELMDEIYVAALSGGADEVRKAITKQGAFEYVHDSETAPLLLKRLRLPATAVAEEGENRYYILDSSPEGESHTIESPPTGDLSLDQQIELARWELEAANSAAESAQERLENAESRLEGLKAMRSKEGQDDENDMSDGGSSASVTWKLLYRMNEALRSD